jgi:hypothetical protein
MEHGEKLMTIPHESHPGWSKAISGHASHNYEFLATKILMGRLTLDYNRDHSPEAVRKSVAELRTFFEKNKDVPKVQADLKKIFGEA